MSRGHSYGVILALGLGFALPIQAQVVRGTLTEAGDRVPLEGAVISLLRETGNTPVAMTLSDASGRFDIAATPGRWRVRAELIGYASVGSAVFELAEGKDIVLELAAPVEAISLAELDVTAADRRCTVRPDDEGLATAVAWEQARKALESSLLGQESDRARFDAVLYERELEPGTMRVREERTEPYHAAGARPFSGASPEDLAARGFVQETDSGTYYFAPDERVLLSDVFLDGHCFRLRRAEDDPDLLGLAFEPIQGAGQPDIEGVVWLDRETTELRSLDYRYVHLRLGVPTEQLGGGMRFERLPTGVWIPRQWWIRMPVIQVRERRVFGRARVERVLSGILERGGEVLSIEADGARLSFDHPGPDTPGIRPDGAPVSPQADRSSESPRLRTTATDAVAAELPTDTTLTGAFELEPLTVTAVARRTPGEAGFHARRERGIGFFLVEEQIERIQPVQMDDLFHAIPGLTVACGQADVLEGGCRVQFERARALDRGGRERPCPVQYFLDGSPVSKGTVDALRPTNVLGMEAYNGLSEVPPQFQRGADTRCGTISVWLKARR